MEIILIRHGKPKGAVNSRLNAIGFSRWVRSYNRSEASLESEPPAGLGDSLNNHFIVSSDLARSVHSVKLCIGCEPDLKLKQLREMDIPRYKLPFVLRAYSWLAMSRILWFAGINGKTESFKAAKERAKISAEYLRNLSKEHEKIEVFGHGLTNKYIAKALVESGWCGQSSGKSYWSIIKLQV